MNLMTKFKNSFDSPDKHKIKPGTIKLLESINLKSEEKDKKKRLFKFNITDKNKRNNYFSSFINNSIEKIKNNELQMNYDLSSGTELLITELSKESFITKHNFIKNNSIRIVNPNKNLILIVSLLKKLSGFKAFLQFNKIDDLTLTDSAMFIEYKKIHKGDIIFKEGDKSDCFYGIIRGKVELRILMLLFISTDYETTLASKPQFRAQYFDGKLDTNHYTVYEQTILQLGEGHCFGEMGVVYNKDRTATAYAIEDLDCFIVNKKFFQMGISRSIFVCDYNRKLFLKHIFPFLKDVEDKVLDIIYKLMVIRYYKINELVYLEEKQALCLFLIYQGECVLTKLGDKRLKVDHKKVNEVSDNKLLYLSPGSISGFEILRKYQKKKDNYSFKLNNEINYNYTCYSTNDSTVIFVIDLEKFSNYKNEFLILMKEIYPKHFYILDKIQNTMHEVKKKFTLKYNNKANQIKEIDSIHKFNYHDQDKLTKGSSTNFQKEKKNIIISHNSDLHKKIYTRDEIDISNNDIITACNEKNNIFNKSIISKVRSKFDIKRLTLIHGVYDYKQKQSNKSVLTNNSNAKEKEREDDKESISNLKLNTTRNKLSSIFKSKLNNQINNFSIDNINTFNLTDLNGINTTNTSDNGQLIHNTTNHIKLSKNKSSSIKSNSNEPIKNILDIKKVNYLNPYALKSLTLYSKDTPYCSGRFKLPLVSNKNK